MTASRRWRCIRPAERRSGRRQCEGRPAITVVIPTYNRVGRWPSVLRGLQSQTLDSDEFEVVVVSDGSTDGTNEYLRSVSASYHYVVEVQPNGGPAVARNRGVELAQAPIIVFLDDDIVAAPSLLEHHLRRHREGHGDTAVIGPMLSPPDAELSAPIRWEQAMLYKQYDAMARGDWEPTYRQFFTGNASSRVRACSMSVGSTAASGATRTSNSPTACTRPAWSSGSTRTRSRSTTPTARTGRGC